MERRLAQIVQVVEDRLTRHFDHAAINPLFAPLPPLVTAQEVRNLTLRGGKRIRAALLACGFELTASGDPMAQEAVIDAAAALELLQSYFLIHDDIMDDDDVRRGGPSVHASLRRRTGSEVQGRNLAILAGDYACAAAFSLMGGLPGADGTARRAGTIFAQMHLDVIAGQELDLLADVPAAEIVRRKTASYTTVGPLCIGAALAGADDGRLLALAQMAQPLGMAFQYRDDLLNLPVAEADTGKSRGRDLALGKRTLLLEEAFHRASPSQRAAIDRVIGHADTPADLMAEALLAIHACGARQACEQTIVRLTDETLDGVAALCPQAERRAFFEWIARQLATRAR